MSYVCDQEIEGVASDSHGSVADLDIELWKIWK